MEQKTFYDYVDAPRLKFLTDKVYFESLEVVSKDNCFYLDDEKIRVKIKFKALKDIPSLSLRMMIHNEDQAPVATTVCLDFISCTENCIYEKEFEFDISVLCSGIYKVLMVAFETNDIGSIIDADAVWPAFGFEKKKDSELNWKNRLLGDIELPQMICIEERN